MGRKLISVLIDSELLDELDELVRVARYPNHAAAIREAVRRLIKAELVDPHSCAGHEVCLNCGRKLPPGERVEILSPCPICTVKVPVTLCKRCAQDLMATLVRQLSKICSHSCEGR